jgi:DNA-binding NarL/FixJ family response regulator
LREILETMGYGVLTAASGEDGLLIAENNNVDLMITGMFLPGVGGLKFLRVFRERHPEVPAIVCTACPREFYYEDAMAAGASAYVQKMFDADEFSEALESSIRGIARRREGRSKDRG